MFVFLRCGRQPISLLLLQSARRCKYQCPKVNAHKQTSKVVCFSPSFVPPTMASSISKDPLGATIGVTAPPPPPTGTVTLVSSLPAASNGDEVNMNAMLHQMEQSVQVAARQRDPVAPETARMAHQSLSRSMRNNHPRPVPPGPSGPLDAHATSTSATSVTSAPAPHDEQTHKMAVLFESLLRPPPHEHTAGCLDKSNMMFMRSEKGEENMQSTMLPTNVTKSPSLAPAEIASHPRTLPHMGLSVPSLIMMPDWNNDNVINDVFKTKWLQLQQVWSVACQRVTQRVRMCENVTNNMILISKMKTATFAPPLKVTNELLQMLQQQFHGLVRQFSPREVVIWNVRKSLREIAKELFHNNIPSLPAWRDEVGTSIVHELNKAISSLSARRSAPVPVPTRPSSLPVEMS